MVPARFNEIAIRVREKKTIVYPLMKSRVKVSRWGLFIHFFSNSCFGWRLVGSNQTPLIWIRSNSRTMVSRNHQIRMIILEGV
jgi:hypothetical protein